MNGNTVDIKEVTGVTWIDDDGAKYRREFVDGEVKDVRVGFER
jgi:hypothetical protein